MIYTYCVETGSDFMLSDKMNLTDLYCVWPFYCKRNFVGTRQHYADTRRYHELIYVTDGECTSTYKGKTVKNSPGTVQFLPKDTVGNKHYIDFISQYNCITFYFDSDVPLSEEMMTYDFTNNSKIKAIFERALQIWGRGETGYYHHAVSLFYSVLYEIEKNYFSGYMDSGAERRIEPAVEYIHKHYCDRDFSYESLPTLCGLKYSYFFRLFVKRFGVSPSQYVKKLKIEKACQLLWINKFSVTQIAEMLGYSDVYYFSRQFKEHMGVAPSQYSSSRMRCP